MRHGGKALLWILGLGLLGKLLLAIYLPLGVDESYAIAVAREFSWSFFDHPPLGFWSPIVSARFFGESTLAFRAPFLLYGLGTGVFLYLITAEIGNRRAALWAAALYNITPFFILSGGVFVVPDGPLNLSLAVAVWALLRIQKGANLWGLVGLALAFAFASKYQAVLLPAAVVLYATFTARHRIWFRQSGPYIASAIALSGLLPVLLWNAQHGWISFTFQGARGGFSLDPDNLAQMLLGQAVYLLPALYVALRGLVGAFKSADLRLLAFVAITPVAAFNILYIVTSNSLPHWPMSGWLFALPLGAIWMERRRARSLAIALGLLVWVLLGGITLQARSGLLTKGTPAWDQTMEVFDWRGLEPALQERELLQGIELLVTTNWRDAGIMSTALHGQYPVQVLGSDPHHFQFMSGAQTGGKALLLQPLYLDAPARETLQMIREIDQNARMLPPVILDRGAQPYIAVSIVAFEMPELPH